MVVSDGHCASLQARETGVYWRETCLLFFFQISREASPKGVKNLILVNGKALIDFIRIRIWSFVVKQL